MSNQAQTFKSFSTAYNSARALYDSDQLAEAIEKAQDLLEEGSLPHYHRIKTLLLLSACADSWHDAQQCLNEADMLWHQMRRFQPKGEDAAADASLEELRDSLDGLQQEQIDTQPEPEEPEEEEELEDGVEAAHGVAGQARR